MKDTVRTRSLSPAKSGKIHGKFTPSPLGSVEVKTADGKTKKIYASRRERRHGKLGQD